MKQTFKQFLAEYDDHDSMKVDGYTLSEELEREEDNQKIMHWAKAPGEKTTTLNHTPYEYISRKAFTSYVAYHKKHGKWPGRSDRGNWRNDTAHKLLDEGIKEAVSLNVEELVDFITPDNVPTGAKTVGGGTMLVYMSGDTNVYVEDGHKLREFLWQEYKLDP